MDGLAAALIPQETRLALVGDADGGNIPRLELGGRERLARRLHAGAPNVLGVVLDPAGRRIMLGELPLPRPECIEARAEHDSAARRGALVDCQYRSGFGHVCPVRW